MFRMCLALWLLFIRSAHSVSFTIHTGVGGCEQPVTVIALLLDDNSEPIYNATVTLTSNGQTKIGLTDQNGEYEASFVYAEPNTYDLEASYVNGSAIFAQWSEITPGVPGEYKGVLPGEIYIYINATQFAPLTLTSADLSNANTYQYPGKASTQVIQYFCDDDWAMSMSNPVDNLLLFMQGWDYTRTYTFKHPFVLVSPLSNENPPTTVLALQGAPWDVTTLFDGLLRFPQSLSDLSVQVDQTAQEVPQLMTLALSPIQGYLSTDVSVSCCVPSLPELTYTDQAFVPNNWPWSPSFKLTVDGLPVVGQKIVITVYDQSNGNSKTSFASCTTGPTDATGRGTCLLTTAIGNRNELSLTARFAGNGCDLTSVSTAVPVSVFGFPDNGKHAFVVSNNTVLSGKVVFWGLDWATQNHFPPVGLSFGGYASVDLTKPTCSGQFTWSLLAGLLNPPKSVPKYMGVLVSTKLNLLQLNGTWNRIIVLGQIKYSSKSLPSAGYGTYLGTYCPTGAGFQTFSDNNDDGSHTPKVAKTKKPTTRKPTHKPTTKKPSKKPAKTAKTAKPSH